MTSPQRPEPVFNTFRRKLYRPHLSTQEFRIGLVCLAVLAGIFIWVLRRGANPDPELFRADDRLLTKKEVAIYKRPLQPWVEAGNSGIFPVEITGDGWTAGAPVAEFDESNLYVKIDGRETFYKSYGFQRLHFITLNAGNLSLDIELFDLGTIGNALGAMAAEVTKPDAVFDGFFYASANAGFLVQGRYYIRMIGSDDHETIRQKVAALKTLFLAKLPAETAPWAYEVLSKGLKISPAKVQYAPRDAFSFDFATEVYSARVAGDTEVFVSRRPNPSEATALAGKFRHAFASFGKPAGDDLFRNEYVNGFDGVTTEGEYVLGIRLAPNPAEAAKWIKALRELLPKSNLPEGRGYE